MSPTIRKLALTTHVTSSVGWLGAVAAFLALALAGVTTGDAETAHAAYLSMEIIARFVIVPLAFATLVTGVVQGLGSSWGLFRHYWVLTKLALTLVATLVLLQKMKLIRGMAAPAGTPIPSGGHGSAGMELVIHAAGGILVLMAAAALSIYKPRGMTAFGARKQKEANLGLPA